MSGFAPQVTEFFEEVPQSTGGTPLVSAEDVANAEGTAEFVLPRQADLKAEDKKDDDDGADEKDKKSGEGAPANGDDDDAEPKDGSVRASFEPAPPQPEDPGNFKPSDLSFDVVIYNEKNESPRTVKIKSMEQFEDLLEKEANFGSPGALLKANRLAAKMETTLEREQLEHEQKLTKYKDYQENQVLRARNIEQNEREIAYLMDRGDLPAMPRKFANADWDDAEVAKHPAVKAQLELFAYMKKENAARKKVGIDPITSMVDAFNAYERSETKKKNDAKAKAQGEARKAAGAQVASASPNPVSTAPKGISVGRTGLLR